jgi:hypothetical protein
MILRASLLVTLLALAAGSATAQAYNGSIGANNQPAPGASTQIGVQDGSGKLQAVSSGNPLPLALSTLGATSTPNGSAVTTHRTFQTALASNPSRKGGILVNTSADKMYVYFGTTGSATVTNSIPLLAGQSISFASGPIVLTDNVAITSDTVDGATYVLVSQ